MTEPGQGLLSAGSAELKRVPDLVRALAARAHELLAVELQAAARQHGRPAAPEGRVGRLRRRMKNELNFHTNFERLVLGCIDANFCNQIRILQHFSRSSRFTNLCTAPISEFADLFHAQNF